ncbi:MAG: hypothetical protein ACREPM_04325 [Gemmatimonadaceae bacterium]
MINFIAALAFPALMAAPTAPPSPPIDSSQMTLVVVQNDRNVPATVYAQNEFGEYKLGEVAAHDQLTMSLADYMIARGEVKFFVQPKGQIEEASQSLDLHEGEHVGLIVPRR